MMCAWFPENLIAFTGHFLTQRKQDLQFDFLSVKQFAILLLLAFYYVEYVLLKELSEIISRYTYVNIIVYLNGNAYAIALSDAEASGKHDFVINVIFFNRLFKKLNDFCRALEMTGRTNANLND